MSDIYLSLTETPSVVTLSQPVIASSVAATVTVGNTVTVALDANSLSALEQVTVTVGAAVTVAGFSTSSLPPSTVTVANTVTIAGTVTANVSLSNVNGGLPPSGFPVVAYDEAISGAAQIVPVQLNTLNGTVEPNNPLPISGTVTASLASVITINTNGSNFSQRVVSKSQLQFSVVAGAHDPLNYASDYTVFPLKITTEAQGRNLAVDLRTNQQVGGNGDFSAISTDATAAFVRTQVVGGSVTIGSLPAISGTVTAAAPNGSLTTRFGTPTTANTAFATSAVTNANRKYLLIQNVTTGSNVITVGIGFTPTTTQGIQLTAGAGITFESSYIPTGAVQILSSVTASNFTILEA